MKPNSYYIGADHCISYRKTMDEIVYSIFSNHDKKLLKSGVISPTDDTDTYTELLLKGGELTDKYLSLFFSDSRPEKFVNISDNGVSFQDRNIILEYSNSTKGFKLYNRQTLDTINFFLPSLAELIKKKNTEISISPQEEFLAFYHDNTIYVYSIPNGDLVWKSEPIKIKENESSNFVLLDNQTLLLPKFSNKEQYTHLYWFDFIQKEIIYSSKELLTNSVILEVQNYDQLLIGYGDAEKKTDLTFSNYEIQQVDLKNGNISSHGYVTSGGGDLFNRSSHLKDSLSRVLDRNEYKDYYDLKTSFPSVYDYLDTYYTYNDKDLTFESISIKEQTPATSDLIFFEDIKAFDPYFKNYQIISSFRNRVTYQDISKDMSFIGVNYLKKELLFWNKDFDTEQKRNTKLIMLNQGIPFFITGDNYYYSSKGIRDYLNFEVDMKWYTFEQFDLIFNRPDIVLERLGYASEDIIKSFRSAYHKRLEKMNFTEEMLRPDFHIPEIQLKNPDQLPVNTKNSLLTFDVIMKDDLYLLDRLNVWINDVPIYGMDGIDLRQENTKFIEKSISLELASGSNKIQLSVLNQAGAESYKETILVNYRNEITSKPDLYLLTIGVSEYQNKLYDLKYASKDANDIKELFERNTNSQYQNVHVRSLLNSDVTKENVTEMKTFLASAKRDDIVIISFAGHGVLDNDFNYILATNNMDFEDPTNNGLPYEELEDLLDGIQPLRKILFIDACHSGEVDKDLVSKATTNVVSKKVGRGAETEYVYEKETHLSTELSKELFNDLRRGTGATVISASGGLEVAYESQEYQNGLFSYCLLSGIKTMAADLDRDGKIMIKELQHFLNENVTKLSNGAQKPTSRIENLEMDWRVW